MAEALESRTLLTGGPRQMEYLSRGVVATRVSSTQAFVSWRSLVTDASAMSFNLYRSTNGGTAVKLNSSPLTGGTNFTDTTTSTILSQPNAYYVKPVISGVEQSASASYTLPANSANGPLIQIPMRNIGSYAIRHMSVADLDGDGEYDYIVDRSPTAVVNEVATQPQIIEAYKSDGTFLWSIDCGPNSFDLDNIEPGASAVDIGNWDGVTAYDMDGDGFAEVLYRSAGGVVFGDGKILAYPPNNDTQYISVIDGRTGAEKSHIQLPSDFIIDGPIAASFGIGYLDGVHPSLVAKMKNRIGDGNFNQMFVAYDYNGTSITQKWKYITAAVDSDNGHNIRIVDVDGDGFDDVTDTAQVISHDGTLKYNMRNGTPSIGHGDRFHIGDLDPNRPGLETYGVQQNNAGLVYEYYADAATGEILHAHYGTTVADIGRGIAADIDPNYPGYEYWAFGGIFNSYTTTPGQAPVETQLTQDPNRPWPNFRIWWDGDTLSENLNNTVIDKWNPTTQGTSRLSTLYHYGSPISTSGEAPIFYGDIKGDWREEVIFENSNHLSLDIYTTQYASSTRLYTLAQNPEYRNCMTTKGYLQSNMVDYYLGSGMATPAMPNITVLASGSAAPKVATAAAATPNPVTGTSVALSALGSDDAGEAALTYTWSAVGPAAVTYTSNGANAAKNTIATFTAAGTYFFRVTITDGTGRSATSNIKVVVNQTVATIGITPGPASVALGSNRQFFATAYDQFSDTFLTPPTFTWNLAAGSGTIDTTGTYTPPATAGSATVRASVGAISGTAIVTISGTATATPTNLTATPIAISQINLAWTDVASGEDGYIIEISQDGTLFSQFDWAGPNATTFNVTGLNPGTTYYFRVRSYNASGASLPTATVSASTFAAPIAWWKLDSATGTTATDDSGNGHDSYSMSTPTWAAGKFGNALNFDGKDSVSLPNNLLTTASGSVSMWFKTSTNFSDYAILFYMSSDTYGNGLGSQSELHVNFTSAEKIQFYARGSAAGLWDHDVDITSASSYNNNSWHHVAATWNVGGSAYLYVDGVQVGTAADTAVFTFGNTQRTYLSRTNLNTNRYTGLMDDVRIYGSPLTPVQVQSLYNASPYLAAPALGTPRPITGTTTSLSVLGVDPVSESRLKYTWTSTGPAPVAFTANGTNAAKTPTAFFITPGIYSLTVTASNGTTSTTSTFNVAVNSTLTALSLTPSIATLRSGQTQAFGATAYDQFGEAMAVPALTWSTTGVGSVNSSGLYTATLSGSANVFAASGSITGSATVQVISAAPTIATPAQVSQTTVTTATVDLTVLGADDGGESSLIYSWSVASGPAPVAFLRNNTNDSKSNTARFSLAGTYVLRATITDVSGNTVNSNILVTVVQTPTRLVLTPTSASVGTGQTKSFVAVALDQFSRSIASPPVAWSVVSGTGSINSSGLFTAGANPGKSVVRAMLGSLTATAPVSTFSWSPYNLTARKLTANTASVSFRDSTTIETGFQIQLGQRQANGTVRWLTLYTTASSAGSGTLVSYTIPSTLATGAWYFRARATSATGYSNWSNSATLSV